eukprot:2115800-Pyramimonas_sp.AAC.1
MTARAYISDDVGVMGCYISDDVGVMGCYVSGPDRRGGGARGTVPPARGAVADSAPAESGYARQ